MKKLIVMLLALCICLGLCACASMDKFEENLGSKYKIEKLDDDDLEDYAELLDLDVDDYNVIDAMEATHKKSGIGVMILECGSASDAEELAEDGEVMVELLESYYSSKYSFDSVAEGRFVLIGEEDAIEDALGK